MKTLLLTAIVLIIAMILISPEEFATARTEVKQAVSKTYQASKALATDVERRAQAD